MNILILGVGGNVSLGILKAILHSKIDVNIIGACISSESIGLYLCDSAYICPYANDKDFVPWVIDICKKEKINIIFTGVEENIKILAQQKKNIEIETGAIFISCSYEQIKIGQNKISTCEWLKNNNLNYPLFSASNDPIGMENLQKLCNNLIAKPQIGKGSKGIIKINNKADLDYVTTLDSYVVQQYIGNESTEYTASCYCDMHGNFINAIIMQRILKDGYTYRAEVVKNDAIDEEIHNICSKFKPTGPLNIQLRLDNSGRPVCFELNVRFSGTAPMRAQFGFNDVVAAIYEYGYKMEFRQWLQPREGLVYRYVNEIYIDNNTRLSLAENKHIKNINHEINYTEKDRG